MSGSRLTTYVWTGLFRNVGSIPSGKAGHPVDAAGQADANAETLPIGQHLYVKPTDCSTQMPSTSRSALEVSHCARDTARAAATVARSPILMPIQSRTTISLHVLARALTPFHAPSSTDGVGDLRDRLSVDLHTVDPR